MVKTPPSATAGASVGRGQQPLKFNNFKSLALEFRALLAQEWGALGKAPGHPAGFAPGTQLPGDLDRGVPALHPLRRLGAATGEAQEEALDPLTRSLAGTFIAVPVAGAAPVAPPGAVVTPGGHAVADFAAIEDAVRRVAWGGDRRRGVARIELGGEHAGTAIVVHGEGRSVGLTVHGSAGAATGELAERLLGRLRARGLDVSSVKVG